MPNAAARLLNRITGLPVQLRTLFTTTIWTASALEDDSLRGRLHAACRVFSLTWVGLNDNKLVSRAAGLSYSSLLSIGPLIAIAVLFSGLALDRGNTDEVVRMINKGILFIAPQVTDFEQIADQTEDDGSETTKAESMVNPHLATLLENFIEGSRSKTVGVLGSLFLIVIVIQLFSSIEDAFNTIWGVRRGRNWYVRIGLYWTIVTLGAVLAFASLALLSASTFASVLEKLPLGSNIHTFLANSGSLVSLTALAVLLVAFYRFIPSTKVDWIPAIIGSITVVALLNLNNQLAFLYLRKVMITQSLYGSVGILVVLMVGLYTFWLILLSGGQLTYAIQNASFQSSRAVWNALSHRTRELISFLVLGLVCRRFHQCKPPYTASHLAAVTRIPNQLLNESLSRLQDLKLITSIPPEDNDTGLDHSFQPARPLSSIRLADFRIDFATLGKTPAGIEPPHLDPTVVAFWKQGQEAMIQCYGDETMADLVNRQELADDNAVQPS
jgi:membrane protein